MPDADFAAAVLPLFEAAVVDIVEWSFDMGWGRAGIPDWLAAVLAEYSAADRLLGHGVTFSPLSGEWSNRQVQWLDLFSQECGLRNYQHVSEHFGFMSAGNFHQSAPLPVPLTESTLAVGQERLATLHETAGIPVGLENLAFAFSIDDVRRQGEFIERLLAPVDGFLLLDLHNIYCQCCNFDVTAEALLDSYPLGRVRELHVSGGSWIDDVRRDTHDGPVPDAVFELVEIALERCPGAGAVVLERMGGTMPLSQDQEQFRRDFERLRELVVTGS